MEQLAWVARLVQTIATEVRRHRQSREYSAQDLADECARLGFPIARQVIANIETGRRDNISVAEFIVLANALGVPPGMLLFPVGRASTAEPLPGQQRPTWETYLWFSGEEPYPDMERPDDKGHSSGSELGAWIDGAAGAYMYREEDELIRSWRQARQIIAYLGTQMAGAKDKAGQHAFLAAMKAKEEELRDIETSITQHRDTMRHMDLLVRELQPELAHLEHEPAT